MKTIKFFSSLCVAAMFFVSCGRNEPYTPYNPDNGGNGGQNSGESVETTVKNNVSATVTYSDFAWNVKITTNLHNVYKNKAIKYGLEYGYNGYTYKPYSDTFKYDSKAPYYKYNESTSGSKTIYSWRTPLYIDNPYSQQQFYWYTYIDIKESITRTSNMNDPEIKSLYDNCLKSLKDAENAALNAYQGRVFAELDGVKYIIREYNQYNHN